MAMEYLAQDIGGVLVYQLLTNLKTGISVFPRFFNSGPIVVHD
jgi:hypothetical protein